MLLDMSLISPIRESASELKTKRRRQEGENPRKVQPRGRHEERLKQDDQRQDKGNSLNAYV